MAIDKKPVSPAAIVGAVVVIVVMLVGLYKWQFSSAPPPPAAPVASGEVTRGSDGIPRLMPSK